MCGSKYNNFVFITTIRNLWLWVVMTWKHTTHKKYFSQDIYMTWYNITAPKNIPHQLATHYCNISLGSIIVIQIWWRLVEYTIRLSIMGDDKYNYITGKMKKLIRVLLQNYFLYEIICLWKMLNVEWMMYLPGNRRITMVYLSISYLLFSSNQYFVMM